MMKDLKPCPFCGASAKVARKYNRPDEKSFCIECINRNITCPVNMRTHYTESQEEATLLWNKRFTKYIQKKSKTV